MMHKLLTVLKWTAAIGVILYCVAAYSAEAADANHWLPDPALTPGAVNASLTKQVICARGWSTKSVRSVSQAVKSEVYKRYGVRDHAGYCAGKEGCEVDHLISLEIGGSNDVTNLWPESYSTKPWNAHVKDKLENLLHKKVCQGAMTLEGAQAAIRTNWIEAYRKLIGDLR